MTRHDTALARRLNARPVRSTLAILLAVSMLPIAILTPLWWVFATVFAAELGLRIRAGRAPDERWWRLFVAVDLLALISFVPVEELLAPTRPELALALSPVMVGLRLMRLLMLLRYAQGLALDVWRILTRREQLAQFGLVTLAVAGLSFASAVMLDQLAQVGVEHEELSGATTFAERLWWAFRQLESSDNLVATLSGSPVVLLMSLGLTLIGVFIVSFIIGIGTNIVEQVVLLERRRRIDWRGHTLIIGPIAQAEVLVREYVGIHAKNRSQLRLRDLVRKALRRGPLPQLHGRAPIALLGTESEAPAFLYEPSMRAVVYRAGAGSDTESLERVAVRGAKRAIVVANSAAAADVDAVSAASVAAFRRHNREAHIFVEVRDKRNVATVAAVGGEHTFALHIPEYVGYFLCHQIVVPGVDRLYAELLTARGAELYSHVFVDEDDAPVLQTLRAPRKFVSFSDLGAALLSRTGCTLVGLIVSDTRPTRQPNGLLNLGAHRVRLNPLAEGSALVDPEEIRGVVGLAPSYLDLRDALRSAWSTPIAAQPETPVSAELLAPSDAGYRHVLVVGYSPALRSLIEALPAFAPGIRITLALSSRRGTAEIRRRLAEIDERLDDGTVPTSAGRELQLGRGAELHIFSHDEADLASFALSRLRPGDPPVDAALFLSDPDSFDPDARTLLRLARFAERYRASHGLDATTRSNTGKIHVIAEFVSNDQSELAKHHCTAGACGVTDDRFRLTIVSTDRIRNYFMVHSSFVPGIGEVYDQLLSKRSPEIVRIELSAGLAPGPLDWNALWQQMTRSRLVPIAVEVVGACGDVEIVTMASREQHPRGEQVRAAFAVGNLDASAAGELVGHPVGE